MRGTQKKNIKNGNRVQSKSLIRDIINFRVSKRVYIMFPLFVCEDSISHVRINESENYI
jgi:hypothetical protein